MTSNALSFIDELQGANYQSLSSTNFQIGIVDPDGSGLTTSQISSLETSGKSLIAYLSIGEAENFRSYWQPSWNTNPPSFLMGQDPNWPGDYAVKFWDPAWQQIVINYAETLAKEGYNGVMLDVVDAYDTPAVAAAAGGTAAAMADMEKFVEAISTATKAINPNFKIIQNNAEDLFTTNANDPTSATNTAYMNAIDGVVAESTFYNPGTATATNWAASNVAYLEHAVAAGKTVLAIEYPSTAAADQSAITKSVADGFVPYIATPDQSLGSTIESANYSVPGLLPANALASLTSTVATVASGGSTGSTGTTTTTTGGSTGDSGGSGSTTTTTGGSTGGSGSTAASGGGSTGGSGTTTASGGGSTGSSGITTGAGTTTTTTPPPTGNIVNVANGTTAQYGSEMNMQFTFDAGFTGHTTIHYFATASGDTIDLAPSVYATAAQALSHVTYHHHDAILTLPNASTITIAGAGHNSLVAADFHIG